MFQSHSSVNFSWVASLEIYPGGFLYSECLANHLSTKWNSIFINVKLHGVTEFVDYVTTSYKLMSNQILTIHKILFKQFDVNFELCMKYLWNLSLKISTFLMSVKPCRWQKDKNFEISKDLCFWGLIQKETVQDFDFNVILICPWYLRYQWSRYQSSMVVYSVHIETMWHYFTCIIEMRLFILTSSGGTWISSSLYRENSWKTVAIA